MSNREQGFCNNFRPISELYFRMALYECVLCFNLSPHITAA